MTAAKLIEYSITRELLKRSAGASPSRGSSLWADRLIGVLAVTTGLLIMGSFIEELLWALLAAATLFSFR
jgi:hypothetical protein